MFKLRPYQSGVLLIVLAAVLLSTFGLMIRFVESDSPWPLVFWRSLGIVITASAIIAARHRSGLMSACRTAGGTALLGGLFLSGSFTFFVLSITSTTVGTTLFIMSVGPFITAVLGWIFLGERVGRLTWATMMVAFAGISVMFVGGLSGGGLAGHLFALAIAICGAGYMVVLRWGRQIDMTMAVFVAGVLSMAIAAIPISPFTISRHDVAIAIAIGILQNGIGQAMIAAGSRHVPATQISLLLMIEVVLGPIWVWLAMGEQLSGSTLVGGSIILLALVGYALGGSLKLRRPALDLLPTLKPSDAPTA